MIIRMISALVLALLGSVSFARGPAPLGHTIQELLEGARRRDPKAIQSLGQIREEKARFLLREIADEPDIPTNMGNGTEAERTNSAHRYAKVALARMGEKKHLDYFISGLSSENSARRKSFIKHLGEIQDKRAVKHLIPILDDAGSAGAAEWALTAILPAIASGFIEKRGGKGQNSPLDWKRWWQDHGNDYENL